VEGSPRRGPFVGIKRRYATNRKALFDPNVLIDYVNGMEAAKVEFEN
jgi:hypothetical protein